MKDDYFKEQAKRVRDIASLADPFTKKRLLALAERYDIANASVKRTVIPSVSMSEEDRTDHKNGGADSG